MDTHVTRFDDLDGLYVTLDDALFFTPSLSNNNSLRNWLLKRPHIRRLHGRVCLPDLIGEITMIDKIKQARADARNMTRPQLESYIKTLSDQASANEIQADYVANNYATAERDRVARTFGTVMGEQAYQRVIAGETVAGARAEAAALRALVTELETQLVSPGARDTLLARGYEAGKKATAAGGEEDVYEYIGIEARRKLGGI